MEETIENKIFNALKGKDWDILFQLVQHEFNLHAIDDEEGKSFAHYAVSWGADVVMKKFIVELRCPLNIVDREGNTPEKLAWRERSFHGFIAERKIMEHRESEVQEYQKRVEGKRQEEAQRRAYRSGMIFTRNFSLFFGSKKEHRKCLVPIARDVISELTVHETQAIIEAHWGQKFASSYYDDIRVDVLSDWKEHRPAILPNTNYVLVNIGCVISTAAHKSVKEERVHDRRFISAPIFLTPELIKDCESKVSSKSRWQQGNAHSEEVFYQYLIQPQVLNYIMRELLEKNGLKHCQENPLKIYSLVFDLISSQDVCDDCEKGLAKFEIDSLAYVKKVLDSMGFHLPVKNEGNNFKIIFRATSVRSPSHSAYRRDHVTSGKKGDFEIRAYTHEVEMDIKKSETPLMLHSDEQHREQQARWYNRENYTVERLLPRYSVFDTKMTVPYDSASVVKQVPAFNKQ